MSRPPTRQLTWPFVLRTFKRLDMISARYSAESIAKGLVEQGVDLGAAEYMSDIADEMRELQRKAGADRYVHPNGNCAECGKAISGDHNAARYCSRECRQRAYRVRKAAAAGRNSPIPKRLRVGPKQAARAAAIADFNEDMARREEAVAFANTMYALHLKAHQGEMKRSATPLDDASITPGDETSVAPGLPLRQRHE